MPIDYKTMNHVGWSRWMYCRRCRGMTCTHHGTCFLHGGLFSRYYWRPCICVCTCNPVLQAVRWKMREHSQSAKDVREEIRRNRAKLTYVADAVSPYPPEIVNLYAYLTDDELVAGIDPRSIPDLLRRKRHP